MIDISTDAIEMRQVALTLLVDLWVSYPEKFHRRSGEVERRAAENMLTVLKRATRDSMKTISSQAVSLMCVLLDKFAQDRNEYAPTIYKALTFLLIDNYYNMDARQEILSNFIMLFRKHRSMPITIMAIPFFK